MWKKLKTNKKKEKKRNEDTWVGYGGGLWISELNLHCLTNANGKKELRKKWLINLN